MQHKNEMLINNSSLAISHALRIWNTLDQGKIFALWWTPKKESSTKQALVSPDN